MKFFPVFIFLLTYAGVALGRVPGLMLDRTGIALLGAIAMVAVGALPLDFALGAIDHGTILLLFALMIVSAQLRLGGFYTWSARRSASLLGRPHLFLFTSMLLSALLSALLANDIVCLAFAPVIAVSVRRAGLNPVPFLLGLALASNIGSAATVIGNPQNMLIGQVGHLAFGSFLAWCLPPTLVSLTAAFGLVCWFYRGRLTRPGLWTDGGDDCRLQPFNRWQSTKGLTATAVLIVLFFTGIPRELSALAVAGFLLCSRHMKSRQILTLVDWHLITLFCALFIVIEAISLQGLPEMMLARMAACGIELRQLPVLAAVATVLSNLVSNVPAVMLLVRFLDPGVPVQWYTLAVASTFAGNLILIGSIANLIVVEQARGCGVAIGFGEHARIGIPVTLVSLAVLWAWIALAA
jgi:Na+/H+ antiporter NhaD/arsenite permease-like protein